MSSGHHEPQRPLSDEQILHAHEHVADDKVDDGGSYKLLPLVMLFLFSGLIFFGGTYLNLFSGQFDPRIFNEHNKPKALGAAAAVDPVILGQKRYNATSSCVTCHLPEGTGTPGAIPPLAGSEWVTSDERAIRIVLNGLSGPITVKGESFGTQVMPNIGTQLGFSDADIAAVLTYVRQSFGNKSPAVTPEKVAEIRAKVANHGAWTEAELKALPQ